MTKITQDPRSQAGVGRYQFPAPRKLTDQEFIDLAMEIGRSDARSVIDAAVANGKRVLDRIYNGNLGTFKEYNRGDKAVPTLVQVLHDLGFAGWSKNRIYRSVLLGEQQTQLGGFDQFKNLKLTHYYEVQGLDVARQKELLLLADEESLSPDQLRAKAQLERRKERQPEADKIAREVLRGVERLRRALGVHDEWLADLTAAGLSPELTKSFDDAIDACARESERVATALSAIKPEPKEKGLPGRPRLDESRAIAPSGRRAARRTP